ncbi:MAG: site-specific integrase [Thermoguttaceae bacterium]|nr:site-specific integrase [Thermoguttaceae bacterium]
MAKLSKKHNAAKNGKRTLKGWQITLDDGRSVFLSAKKFAERAAFECRDLIALIERDLTGGGQWGAGRFSDHTEKALSRIREDRPAVFELLQEKGIIPGAASITIGELYRKYREAARAEGKKAKTLENNENGVNRLFRYFPRETLADAIEPKDAQAFVNWLLTEAEVKGRDKPGYSQAAKAGTVAVVRKVWNWGVKMELVKRNPFGSEHIVKGSFVNAALGVYVGLDDFRRVLDAYPTREHRALFALYRFGGLRAEEALLLRWRDVDFKAGLITVRSTKTEHVGKGTRQTPLYPQLREELEAWRRDAEEQGLTDDEDARIIARYTSRANVGTSLKRIVEKAGVKPWPRLLQNLRASAATDICAHFGRKCESVWVGHSEEVSLQHYQQITPEAKRAALTNANLFG